MRSFSKDAPRFLLFKMEGSSDVYELPLASSMPPTSSSG